MIALVRYELSDSLRSTRWLAPLVVFLVSQGLLDASSGDVVQTYSGSAVVLFFISCWITVAFSQSEDPLQELITIASARGRWKVQLAKLMSATSFNLALSALALIVPPIVSSARTTLANVATGATALAMTVLAGVAVGALCSRPIIKKASYAVLLGIAIGFGDAIMPNGPPIRQIVDVLGETRPHNLGLLMFAIAAETVALATVLVLASIRISATRT